MYSPQSLQINKNSPFVSYNLNAEQIAEGSKLTELQLACIQNMLADYAMQKLALAYDAENPTRFIQAEADLAGRIIVLQNLIDTANYLASSSN